jgi:hypothetical protein
LAGAQWWGIGAQVTRPTFDKREKRFTLDVRRVVSLNAVASVTIAIAAAIAALFVVGATGIPSDEIATAVLLGLALGVVYGGASGYFDHPNADGSTPMFAVNVAPVILLLMLLAAFFSTEDPGVRQLVLVGVFGAGVGNGVSLLAWRVFRGRGVT